MFLLAHLSDVHLAPLPPMRFRDVSPKRVLGLINWHSGRKRRHRRDVLDRIVADMREQAPDHIAVTGDLVNIGLPAELAAAERWLQTLGPPERVTAIPGNHDVYGRMRRDRGIMQWQAYMSTNVAGAAHAVADGEAFPFVRRFGAIALIGTSTAIPTAPFLSSGKLRARQRQALGRLLAALGREGLFRIVLIHHPPLPGQAGPGRGLRDAAGMAAVLAEHGAELVLHGHNHRPMLAHAPGPHGPIPVVGAPSASASLPEHEPGARYNLITIEEQAEGWRVALESRGIRDGRNAIATIERIELGEPARVWGPFE